MSLKKPAVVLDDELTLHVFRRRVNGSLRYSKGLVRSEGSGERQWSSIDISNGGSAMSSAPVAVYGFDNKNQRVDVFWRNSDGMLQHGFHGKSTEWRTDTVSKTALASAPAATYNRSLYTFWRHADSTLHCTWYGREAGTWKDERLVSDRLLGAPTTLASSSESERMFDVFWASLEGEVKRTSWTEKEPKWRTEQISQAEPRIDAGALPQRLVNSSVGLRVYWRGLDCLLHEARHNGTSWERRRLMHGEVASDPAPLHGIEAGRIDVFWKSPDGILMDSVCTGASGSESERWLSTPYALTNSDDDAPVISEPVALMDTVKKGASPRVLPRVLWVSVDDDLHETYYTGQQWVTGMVDAADE